MSIISLLGYILSIVAAAFMFAAIRYSILGPKTELDREQNDPDRVSDGWLVRFRR